MSHLDLRLVNRRFAVSGLVVSAAGIATPRRLQGRAITQRGMAGGGLVQLEEGNAAFSIIASRVSIAGQGDVLVGSIKWVDETAGHEFISTTIDAYDMLHSPEEGAELRRIAGMMRLNAEGAYPFVLNVLDAGAPGSGRDTLALIVGDGAVKGENATPASGFGFSYAVAGPVIGDVQDVNFELGAI